jgi:ABC-type branched-subunit amino acid transport system substrate-binding protein
VSELDGEGLMRGEIVPDNVVASHHRGARAAGCFALAALCGCTAIVFDDAAQCETTADCAALGPAFAGQVCTAERVCALPGEVECQTSQECVATLGVATARCSANRCVNLVTEDCQVVAPLEHAANDDAIIIGFMGPLEGDFVSIGIPIQRAAQLAFEEFQNRASGLPPGGGSAGRRPLVLLGCHDLGPDGPGDQPGFLRVANHLAKDVKVPAIIGPLFSGITLEVINNVTIGSDVLTISPSATSPVFTEIDDNDLMWRTVPSDALQAIPLAEMVGRIETKLRDDLVVPSGAPIKVVIVSNDNAYGQGLFDALTDVVIFNGQSAAANQSSGNLLLLSYEDPAANGNTTDFSLPQTEILAFRPHLIIALGTNEIVQSILDPIEAGWSSLTGSPPRPRWLLPDGGKIDEALAAVEKDILQLKTSPPLRQRLRGTAAASTGGALYDAFRLRFSQRFGSQPGIYTENSYDAAYLLGYAIVAAGNGPVTGSHIAAGLMKMSAGASVDVGPSVIQNTLNALGGGGTIDFNGASGPLDFDNETGEAPNDIDVWCVGLNNQNDTVFVGAGIVYEAELGAVAGTDTCELGGCDAYVLLCTMCGTPAQDCQDDTLGLTDAQCQANHDALVASGC